jgi:hypothetical protein
MYVELEAIAASRSGTYKAFSSRGEIIFVQTWWASMCNATVTLSLTKGCVSDSIQKYGMNYGAMAKDIKLNTHQHTAKQLQAKVSVVLSLSVILVCSSLSDPSLLGQEVR